MESEKNIEKAVVSVTGKNHTGIVAKLAAAIADDNGSFMDIQQTIVNDYFTMVFVVDITNVKCDFSEFRQHLLDVSKIIGVDIKVVHESIFHAMNRI